MSYLFRTEDLLEILHAVDAAQLRLHTLRLCQRLGYEFFAHGQRRGGQVEICSTYPASWQRLYSTEGLINSDPTIEHARRSCLPLIWTRELFETAGGQRVGEMARSFGIRSGMSLSCRDNDGALAIFTLASDIPMGPARERHSRQTLPEAMLLASYYNQAARRLNPPVSPQQEPDDSALLRALEPGPQGRNLTVREMECLQWAMAGKTSWETGQIIGCTERTVNFHIGNIMRKLGVRSRRVAVARALSLKLLQP